MKSKLSIVIRDSSQPCNPYSATAHSFVVGIFNCDMSPFAIVPLTGVGPGGGRIFGEIEVPTGTYIVGAAATCKNVWTNWVLVVVGCGQDVCVNILPRTVQQCIGETRAAIMAAIASGPTYPFSSPPQEISKEMRNALEQTRESLEALSKHLPEYESPVSVEALAEAKAPEELVRLWGEL